MFTTPRQISRALDRVLHKVTQPARYTGGELNSIPKNWDDPAIRSKLALAFPDIYELGGSNLGLMVLYDLINKRDDLLAERVYCPWSDFETVMRRDGIPPLRPGKRATRSHSSTFSPFRSLTSSSIPTSSPCSTWQGSPCAPPTATPPTPLSSPAAQAATTPSP